MIENFINQDSPDVFHKEVKSRCIFQQGCTDNIFLSVIIPTYKRAQYLEEAINSALNQQNPGINYEVVVVSNDPEFKLREMHNYTGKNISFYVNDQNIGMMGNWNRGLMLAKGKYAAYLHDDDLLKDNYIQEITKIILNDKYKNAGAFMLERESINYLNTTPPNIFSKIKHLIGKTIKYLFRAALYFRHLWRDKYTVELKPYMPLELSCNIYNNPSCGCVFDREKLIADGGWCEEGYPGADYYTCVRFNFKHKIFRVRKKLGYYRWSINASSEIKAKTWRAMHLGLYKKYCSSYECFSKFLSKWEDVYLYKIMRGLPENDIQELCSFFDVKFVRPSMLRQFLFVVRRKLFVALHNLD